MCSDSIFLVGHKIIRKTNEGRMKKKIEDEDYVDDNGHLEEIIQLSL
jgi:hypothetical protein